MFAQLTSPTPTPTTSPAPTLSPSASYTFDLDLDKIHHWDDLFRTLGLDGDEVPVWQLQGWYLFGFIILAALTVLLLRAIYRGMQHPRLELTDQPDGPPTVTGRSIWKYLTTPVLLDPLWLMAILTILVLAANRGTGIRPGNELIIAAAVVVGASRLLAHLNLEAAHELAKSVPLTVVSLFLILGQTISFKAALVTMLQLLRNIDSLLYYMILIAIFDVVVTAIWFALVQSRWHRRRRREEGTSARRPAWWEKVVAAWGTSQAGASLPDSALDDPAEAANPDDSALPGSDQVGAPTSDRAGTQ
jgi:hypothetical protein